jgi:hypothetical protein
MHLAWHTPRFRHVARSLTALALLAGAFGAQPAAAATRAPGRIVTDLQVIIGGSDAIQCPAGFRKLGLDLNSGEGGDFVYLCEQFGTDASRGIGEL